MDKIFDLINKNADLAKDAADYIWANPEVGYKEYKTNAYMMKAFEDLGYKLTRPDNLTGFTATLDTGKDGPTVAVVAELDALYCKEHPETSKETGAVHACGHHLQCSSALLTASVIKEKIANEKLCGKVKFIIVPAEEGIDISFREVSMKEGKLSFNSGKPEFFKRGLFDGVDIVLGTHAKKITAENVVYSISPGNNGNIKKKITILGKAAHAGAKPNDGINALNAYTLCSNAINALRETFVEKDYTRVHYIISEGGNAVNVVPDKIVFEMFVRGANLKAIERANDKVNRAIACCCASIGAKSVIKDMSGSMPFVKDKNLIDLSAEAISKHIGKEKYELVSDWNCSSTDFGDVSMVLPTIEIYVGGVEGTAHGKDYRCKDPRTFSINASKYHMAMIYELLKDNAKKAKEIKANFKPYFSSVKDYLAFKYANNREINGVEYGEDKTITIKY